jgi:hypothetical protein
LFAFAGRFGFLTIAIAGGAGDLAAFFFAAGAFFLGVGAFFAAGFFVFAAGFFFFAAIESKVPEEPAYSAVWFTTSQ